MQLVKDPYAAPVTPQEEQPKVYPLTNPSEVYRKDGGGDVELMLLYPLGFTVHYNRPSGCVVVDRILDNSATAAQNKEMEKWVARI